MLFVVNTGARSAQQAFTSPGYCKLSNSYCTALYSIAQNSTALYSTAQYCNRDARDSSVMCMVLLRVVECELT